MKHKRVFVAASIFFVFVTSSLFMTAGNADEVTAVVYVDPPQLDVPANEYFTVNIMVKDVADLYAWELKLYYRNDVLNGTELVEGAFLKEGGSTFFYVVEFNDEYNGTHGRLWVACTLLGMMAGQTGQGVLATVGFFAVATGVSALSLRDTKLVPDPEPVEIPHDSSDGTVAIHSSLPGDVNHNAEVNYEDLFILSSAYGSKLGDEDWNPHTDLNSDYKVNYEDFFILASNYGEEWTGS